MPVAGPEFDDLYRSYAPLVRRLALRRTGDRELAEDITQETFLRAYRHLGTLDPSRPAWPWLATVAGNLCKDALRSRASRPQQVSQEPPGDLAAASSSGDPEARVLATERRHHMGETLRRMNPRHRRVLLRQSVEGWRYAEIAREEGVSVDTVKPLLVRARQSFRHTFAALSAEGPRALVVAALARLRAMGARLGGQGAEEVARGLGASSPAFASLLFAATVALAAATGLGDVSLPTPADDRRAGATGVAAAPPPVRYSVVPATSSKAKSAPRPRRMAPFRSPPRPRERPLAETALKAQLQGGKKRSVRGRLTAGEEEDPHYTIHNIELYCEGSAIRTAACDALDSLPIKAS